MQTVVLAAGQGTRMRPLTDRRPKPMLPVADRPMVAHTVDAAIAAGASRIVLVVGYESDPIVEYFGESYAGVPIEYVHQEAQAGTADAVRTAAPALADEPFAVLNGDALFAEGDLASLYDDGPAIASVRVDDPTQYGVLDVEGGVVTGIVEKPTDPPSNRLNAGAYRFPAAALEWLDVPESDRGEHELTDVLERTIEAVDVRPVTLSRWLDVGRPWELLEANEWKIASLAEAAESADDRVETEPAGGPGGSEAAVKMAESDRSFAGVVSEDATIEGPVVVEAGATVREGVTIEGPALIRSGATVGPNAYVRGTTLVGENASVGHAVEVKNSVLMAGAAVNHLSYVGDSILGRDVNFGAGTVVANLRHDDDPVELTVKGERVSTGRRKFGVVVGDEAKTGIDSNLNAGVTLSTGATSTPGESVTRDR